MQTRFLPSQRGKQSHQRLKSLESLKTLNSMALAGQEGPNVHMAACIARHVRPKFFERNLHSVPCKKDNTSWFPCLITQDIHVLRVVQMMANVLYSVHREQWLYPYDAGIVLPIAVSAIVLARLVILRGLG